MSNPMRPPVVQRQTPPTSGLLLFFPPFSWQGQRPGSWANVLSFSRGRGSMRPHTRLEVLPPWRWRVPRDVVPSSAPSNLSVPSSRPPPQGGGTVAVRQCAAGAGRGSTQPPWRPSPQGEEPERVSTPPPRAQGCWPLGSSACTDMIDRLVVFQMCSLPLYRLC